MTDLEKLTKYIKKLPDETVTMLLDAVALLLPDENEPLKPACPFCGSSDVIRYGHKCGKQRFLCKSCGRTFMTATHTVMSHSHFPADVWKESISDTIRGNALNYTAARLGINHQTAFNMRHKILPALQQLPDVENVLPGEVSELDETFVPDCYKGKTIPGTLGRGARKHGAKARKRGISNEYVCICTGIQRNGSAYAASVNRARPDAEELKELSREHIAQGTLILCDGSKSYKALPPVAECTIKDCSEIDAGEKCFYNLNTVNGFHSFIKRRYDYYRGVATKYLNRYNALFASAYRKADTMIRLLVQTFLDVSSTDYYHSNKTVKEMDMLAI